MREKPMRVRELTKEPLSAAELKNGPKYIYIMRAGPLTKIGISRDIDARASGINVGSPYPIEIVRRWHTPFAREIERNALELLDNYRTKGEWFSVPPQLAVILVSLLIVIRPRTAPARRMMCRAILLCTACSDNDQIKSPAVEGKTYVCRKCAAPMQPFNLSRKASIYRVMEEKSGQVGFDGRFEIGTRQVDDPLEKGQRVYAAVNVRESAIEHLASRNRINKAQSLAGDRFRKLWEGAAIGAVRGIDPTRDVVDGNGSADPISDMRLAASEELKGALRAIGAVGSRILVSVMEEGSIEKTALKWSKMGGILKGRRAEGYITGTLIDALDGLVKHWKLEGTARPRAQKQHYKRFGEAVAVYDAIVAAPGLSESGAAYEISVGRFGDIERREIRPVDRGPLTAHSAGSAEVASPRRMRQRTPPKT